MPYLPQPALAPVGRRHDTTWYQPPPQPTVTAAQLLEGAQAGGQYVVVDTVARADTASGLGVTDTGQVYKQSSPNHRVLGGAIVKATGTGSVRYFSLVETGVTGDWTLEWEWTTNGTTNTSDAGFVIGGVDSTATQGGQVYVSFRKTAGGNSVRILHRADTSGADTALVTNASAGWADATNYTGQIKRVGDTIEVTRGGVTLVGPYAVTGTALTSLNSGTNMGPTHTNTDTGSRIEQWSLFDPAGAPPAPTITPTTTRVIAHRGTLASASDSTENSVAGLDLLATLRRPVSGVEWDVRVSSDGELFLMHDETGARTHPAMGATGVEGYTAAQLDTFGVTRLTTALAAVPGRGLERVNLQHYFPGSNTAAMTKLFVQVAASPVPANRVKVMTSISGPYAPVQIRAAWAGAIGTYGSTAANYAGSGDGKAADFSASSIGWAYLPPGGYTANRAHAQALIAGGTIKVGASTENSSTTWAQAHADGADEVLTDNADEWLALYEPPPAPQEATLGRPVAASTARTVPAVGSVSVTLGRALTAAQARQVTVVPGTGLGVLGRATVASTARLFTSSGSSTATLARALTGPAVARTVTPVPGATARTLGRPTTSSTARALVGLQGQLATLGRATTTATARTVTVAASVTRLLGRPITTSTARTVVVVPGVAARVLGRASTAATARGFTTLGGQLATLARATTTSTARTWTPAPGGTARTLERATTAPAAARTVFAQLGTATRTLGRPTTTATARPFSTLGGTVATLARALTGAVARAWSALPGGTARTLGRPTTTSTARPLYGGGGRPYGATLSASTGDAELVTTTAGGSLGTNSAGATVEAQ